MPWAKLKIRVPDIFVLVVSSRSLSGKDSKWPISKIIRVCHSNNHILDCCKHDDIRRFMAENCCDSPYHHRAISGEKDYVILYGVERLSVITFLSSVSVFKDFWYIIPGINYGRTSKFLVIVCFFFNKNCKKKRVEREITLGNIQLLPESIFNTKTTCMMMVWTIETILRNKPLNIH